LINGTQVSTAWRWAGLFVRDRNVVRRRVAGHVVDALKRSDAPFDERFTKSRHGQIAVAREYRT